MGLHNDKYYLSNSEMTAWESGMCPRVWKARFIDNLFDFEPSEAMMWGSYFETLAIGSGVNGKITEPTESMARSVYADRVRQQAKDCRAYFKAIGGKILSKQEYIYTSIVDGNGQEILICGGLDVLMGFPKDQNRPNTIIDLKFTGDNDNDFGPYQFGNPEKVNPQQGIHYKILHRAKYDEDCDFEWWIFDKSPEMKKKRIGLTVSEITEAIHIDKLSRIYNEITFSLALDDWSVNNTFENCSKCPVKCNMERVMPEVYDLIV